MFLLSWQWETRVFLFVTTRSREINYAPCRRIYCRGLTHAPLRYGNVGSRLHRPSTSRKNGCTTPVSWRTVGRPVALTSCRIRFHIYRQPPRIRLVHSTGSTECHPHNMERQKVVRCDQWTNPEIRLGRHDPLGGLRLESTDALVLSAV